MPSTVRLPGETASQKKARIDEECRQLRAIAPERRTTAQRARIKLLRASGRLKMQAAAGMDAADRPARASASFGMGTSSAGRPPPLASSSKVPLGPSAKTAPLPWKLTHPLLRPVDAPPGAGVGVLFAATFAALPANFEHVGNIVAAQFRQLAKDDRLRTPQLLMLPKLECDFRALRPPEADYAEHLALPAGAIHDRAIISSALDRLLKLRHKNGRLVLKLRTQRALTSDSGTNQPDGNRAPEEQPDDEQSANQQLMPVRDYYRVEAELRLMKVENATLKAKLEGSAARPGATSHASGGAATAFDLSAETRLSAALSDLAQAQASSHESQQLVADLRRRLDEAQTHGREQQARVEKLQARLVKTKNKHKAQRDKSSTGELAEGSPKPANSPPAPSRATAESSSSALFRSATTLPSPPRAGASGTSQPAIKREEIEEMEVDQLAADSEHSVERSTRAARTPAAPARADSAAPPISAKRKGKAKATEVVEVSSDAESDASSSSSGSGSESQASSRPSVQAQASAQRGRPDVIVVDGAESSSRSSSGARAPTRILPPVAPPRQSEAGPASSRKARNQDAAREKARELANKERASEEKARLRRERKAAQARMLLEEQRARAAAEVAEAQRRAGAPSSAVESQRAAEKSAHKAAKRARKEKERADREEMLAAQARLAERQARVDRAPDPPAVTSAASTSAPASKKRRRETDNEDQQARPGGSSRSRPRRSDASSGDARFSEWQRDVAMQGGAGDAASNDDDDATSMEQFLEYQRWKQRMKDLRRQKDSRMGRQSDAEEDAPVAAAQSGT
jgi:hypothetical protein